MAKSAVEEFIERGVSCQSDDCLIWPFGKNGKYPAYKKGRGHVEVCRRAHGVKPADKALAAHSCGQHLCINQRHLRWATEGENTNDRIKHGDDFNGEKHPAHKLTTAQVAAIRCDHRPSPLVAADYGVCASNVRSIRHGGHRKVA